MAKVLMVQGTMSNAGKSLITAGLLRVFKQDGYKVAPFKSQNMALNSYVTKEGLEMGRAQVMQAEAAGIEPLVCMNPILLKPTSDKGSQVIVNGKPIGNMDARKYFEYKTELIPEIKKAFKKLADQVDIIVIEGAGSPAEINLKKNDIVNMGMAEMVDSNVLLVGDIDRGGVFAQLLGTMMLLEDDEKNRVKGLVINKFRGDKTILDPGIKMLEERALIPLVGLIPYVSVRVDDEDSLSSVIENKSRSLINICVIRLPHISNYTDFYSFEEIDGVSVFYADKPSELSGADMVIIPGTKNTIEDLIYLRESGFEAAIKRFSRDKIVFGICGGYQMLGNTISDPLQVESGGSITGMELLDMDTVITKEKRTIRVSGKINTLNGPLKALSGMDFSGYEIHMGKTSDTKSDLTDIPDIAETIENISYCPQNGESIISNSGNVYGSYIHGLFDEAGIAEYIVRQTAKIKGIDFDGGKNKSHREFKEEQYDILADMIRSGMDMKAVYSMLKEASV